MLKPERHRTILERLRADGRVLASALSAELGVSDDTVRRDLADLAGAGVLQRVHGGAVPTSPALVPFAARERQAPEAKRAVARAAAALVRDGQAAILDGGTTARLVAEQLAPGLRATVLTHSPTVAEVLAEHPTVEVVLLGGRLQKASRVAVGAATVEALRMVRADVYLLGVGGLHPEVGLSTGDLEEAHVKRAMIASAAEVVALATPEKLGTAARYVFGAASDLTHLVTGAAADEAQLAPYARLGVTVVRA
jgi:DeoR/GlpR family transcriptional regulator of sugar metabolism